MRACARCLDACIGDQKMADCAKLCRDRWVDCNACAILCAYGSKIARACAKPMPTSAMPVPKNAKSTIPNIAGSLPTPAGNALRNAVK